MLCSSVFLFCLVSCSVQGNQPVFRTDVRVGITVKRLKVRSLLLNTPPPSPSLPHPLFPYITILLFFPLPLLLNLTLFPYFPLISLPFYAHCPLTPCPLPRLSPPSSSYSLHPSPPPPHPLSGPNSIIISGVIV